MMGKIMATLALTVIGPMSMPTNACEKFMSFSIGELKEYRSYLTAEEADPFDRLAAFEKLVCSDNPNIRNYAIKEGLNNATEPLVRNQVMLVAMLQKKRVDVTLKGSAELTEKDKEFIAKHDAVYKRNVASVSQKEGCVSMNGKECENSYSIFIIGDRAEFNYSGVRGTFELSNAGQLVGYLRGGSGERYSNIPAIIELF